MFSHILLPTDGRAGSTRAIRTALSLAATTGASVTILYVIDSRLPDSLHPDSDVEAIYSAAQTWGYDVTEQVEALAGTLDIETESDVTRGIPHTEIVEMAQIRGCDAIVMGTRGQTADRLGSTAERVVTMADVPVLTVAAQAETDTAAELSLDPAAVPAPAEIDRLLVPVDGSDGAERAAETAIAIAQTVGAQIHFVYVIDSSYYEFQDSPRSIVGLLRNGAEQTLEALIGLATDADIRAAGTIRRGEPATEIRSVADDVDSDYLILGTSGQSDLPEYILGSTARRVISTASQPVLTVTEP